MLQGLQGHIHLLYSLLSAKTCLGVEFLKHSLSIAQQLRSLVSCRKMKPICLSVDLVSCSARFSLSFLFIPVCKAWQVLQWMRGSLCAWLQQLLIAMYRKWKEKIAAVDDGRAGERWMERCQRIREMMKDSGTETPMMLCSLSFPLSLPTLHDSSINGDTLVSAGQPGLALPFSQDERWSFFSPPT